MRIGTRWTAGDERGISLVEQMVALGLGSVVLLGVLSVWHEAQQAYLDGAEAAAVQQDLRITMARLTRAIQAAGANPTNQTYAGAVPNDPAFVAFREAGPSCLRIYADLNGDGNVARAEENVKFASGGSPDSALTQEAGGGPDAGQPWIGPSLGAQEVAPNIVPNPGGVPAFQFFTGPNDAAPNTLLPQLADAACGMPEADRSRIASVLITLTAEGRVGAYTFRRTLVSAARPRNVP